MCIGPPYLCPYATKCVNPGSWSTEGAYNCWITSCGSAKCSTCPSWIPDMLTASMFKSWCAYVCTTQTVPPKVVAVAMVGVRGDGTSFPKAPLAWCVSP
jgi:hypothetical protein